METSPGNEEYKMLMELSINEVGFIEEDIDNSEELNSILIGGIFKINTAEIYITATQTYLNIEEMEKAIDTGNKAVKKSEEIEEENSKIKIMIQTRISDSFITVANSDETGEELKNELLILVSNILIKISEDIKNIELTEEEKRVQEIIGEVLLETAIKLESIANENEQVKENIINQGVDIEEIKNSTYEIVIEINIDIIKVEQESEEKLNSKLETEKSEIEKRISNAYMRLSIKDYEKARDEFLELEELEEVKEKYDYIKEVKFGLGEAYKGLGDINNAIETYKRILTMFMDYNSQNKANVELKKLYEMENKAELIILPPLLKIENGKMYVESEIITDYKDIKVTVGILDTIEEKNITEKIIGEDKELENIGLGKYIKEFEMKEYEGGIYYFEIYASNDIISKTYTMRIQIGEIKEKAKIKNITIDTVGEKVYILTENYSKVQNELQVKDKKIEEESEQSFVYEFKMSELNSGLNEVPLYLYEDGILIYKTIIEIRKPVLENVKFAKDSIKIKKYEKIKLEIIIEPIDAYIEEFEIYVETGKDIISIDENMEVTGLKAGKATVKAIINKKEIVCEIEVEGEIEIVLESIAITKPAEKLVYYIGESLEINGLEVMGCSGQAFL